MTQPVQRQLLLPGPDSPAIDAALVSATNTAVIPRYGDLTWPLAALSDNPSAPLHTIHWGTIEDAFREELRYLAWLMLNEALPDSFLIGKGSGLRSRCSAEMNYRTVRMWARFATWLSGHGATTLAEVTEQHLRAYADHLNRQGLSRGAINPHLMALSRLWAFDTIGNAPRGLPEPPWHREGSDDFLPGRTPGGENSTAPIAPATMGPLLVWALRTVEEFADDIWAAQQEADRITTRAGEPVAKPSARKRVRDYLENLRVQGLPLPSATSYGRRGAAISYIAGHTSASLSQVRNILQQENWRSLLRPGGCPLTVPITATIDGQPWREAIDFTETTSLVSHLLTACFIVLAYTTGMRPTEVLALRTGCCPDPESGRHMITGQVFKTARDEEGNHLSQGRIREAPWVAIPPAVTAIRVLERFTPEGLLFNTDRHSTRHAPHRTDGERAVTCASMGYRIERFVDWANEQAQALDRPHEQIPADPHGPIGTRRFRRSLAWHIARRPGGLIALAIQYGHLRTAISGNYASRSRDGVHDLLDIETARATADTLTDLNDALAAQAGVSGPAARRAINAARNAPSFAGALTSARQARDLLANPALAIHDNPHALLLCVYDPHKALCRRRDQQETPTLDRCVAGCANISRTDQQARQLHLKAEALEKQAAGPVPHPLAARLRSHATQLRTHAQHHDRTRTTLESPQ
jgi:integrase